MRAVKNTLKFFFAHSESVLIKCCIWIFEDGIVSVLHNMVYDINAIFHYMRTLLSFECQLILTNIQQTEAKHVFVGAVKSPTFSVNKQLGDVCAGQTDHLAHLRTGPAANVVPHGWTT